MCRLVAQPLGFGLGRSFGDRPHDRLGIAGPHQQPLVGPVEPQAVEMIGLSVGKMFFSAASPAEILSLANAILVLTIS